MLTSGSGESPIGGGDQPVRAMCLAHGCRQAMADNLLLTPFKRLNQLMLAAALEAQADCFAARCAVRSPVLIKNTCAADAKV